MYPNLYGILVPSYCPCPLPPPFAASFSDCCLLPSQSSVPAVKHSVLHGAPRLDVESFRPGLAAASEHPFLLFRVPHFSFSRPLHALWANCQTRHLGVHKGLRSSARPNSCSLPVFAAAAADSSKQVYSKKLTALDSQSPRGTGRCPEM